MKDVRHVASAVLFLVSGILDLLESESDFESLEEGVHRLVQETSQKVFAWVLEQVDDKLLGQRDESELEVVKSCERTWVSTFGSLTVKRRLYRERGTGQYRFLLDEALGSEVCKRLTARMEAIAVELGTEMPFRRAAKILECLCPGVSAMTVWGAVRDTGHRAVIEAKEARERVFEQGEVPQGNRRVDKLRIEGDGVVVGLQRAEKRHDEVKLVVGYEGKVEGARRSLKSRRTVAGLVSGEEIWQEAGVELGRIWDLGHVREVHVGGDGAAWIRQGAELFGGEYHLDPFHLRRHLTEALGFDSTIYKKVSAAVRDLDHKAVMGLLEMAAKRVRGAARRRVVALREYLEANWDGLKALPEEDRLGAIEGQVRHTIARRMKRIGARWTPGGADRMARLLAAKANNELERYLGQKARSTRKPMRLPKVSATGMTAHSEEDVEAWLRVKLPALTGPFASRDWIKHVLRTIASIENMA